MLDVRTWLEGEMTTCMDRRSKRGKRRMTEAGKQWYMEHTWANHCKLKQLQLAQAKQTPLTRS